MCRGGKQATAEGGARKLDLDAFFRGLCRAGATTPHIIVTQADIGSALSTDSCFHEISICGSGPFWRTETDTFGDGHTEGIRTRSKVYARKALLDSAD